jgi:hypothetical protein
MGTSFFYTILIKDKGNTRDSPDAKNIGVSLRMQWMSLNLLAKISENS